MHNPNQKRVITMGDQVTKQEMAEFTNTILEAMNSMYQNLSEKIERSETRMKAYIENGVEKRTNLLFEKVDALSDKVDALTEKVDTMEQRQTAMEEHLGRLTEDVQEIKMRLAVHDEEIYTLRRVK